MNKLLTDWKTLSMAAVTAALYYHLGLDLSLETALGIGLDLALGFTGVAGFYCAMIGRGMREVGWL